jgi:hypothetical protein
MELLKEDAKLIYDIAPKHIKDKLDEEFGSETFRKISWRDLNSFEDLCKARGTTAAEFLDKLIDLPISQTQKTIAKFELMNEGINQGWKPDILDTSQKKWFPIFSVSSRGLAFSYSGYCYDSAYAAVGFPFVFESKEQSDHAGKQFIQLWEEFILHKIN